jgi:hypothetical protein
VVSTNTRIFTVVEVLPFFLPAALILRIAGPEAAKNVAGENLRLIQDPFNSVEYEKNLANLSRQFAARANRRFRFQKRRQLSISTHVSARPLRDQTHR